MNAAPHHVDVVIIGGGPAGLAAATALGRSRRSVLVIDAGEPRNAPAAHAHNIFTRDGANPLDLLTIGRGEVESYDGRILTARVDSATKVANGFRVTTDAGDTVHARRLVLTTGLVDVLPELPGLAERWGRDVLHCPYCHGWEVRDQAIGVLATGPAAVHQALLFRQLSDNVTVFQHTADELGADDAETLSALGIRVVTGRVESLVVTDDALAGVRLADRVEAVQALVVGPRFEARSALAEGLGVTVADHPMGSLIPSDDFGLTNVPGVWVAGNVTDLKAQVVTSASGGLMAGAAINYDLIEEDAAAAVAAHRTGHAPAPSHDHDSMAHTDPSEYDQAFWDDRYASAESVWSGNPNPQLVADVSALAPGRALDVGCGEGADALWLAERGWNVTAIDISTVALDRATQLTRAKNPGAAARIGWQQHDLLDWAPPAGAFDLVSAQFMHLVAEQREVVFARLAAAVAPGGSLLIVGHRPSDLHHGHPAGFFFTAEEIAADLGSANPDAADPDAAEWEVVVAETRDRTMTGPDGQPVAVQDEVVHARRRA